MDSTLEYLIAQIEERRKSLIDSLGDGAAKDYAAYQHSVGVLRGYQTVQGIIYDLAKRMELSDE